MPDIILTYCIQRLRWLSLNPDVCHLSNFVFHRVHDPRYVRVVDRQLRRFDAPIMTEIGSNNSTFSRSVLFQGALLWNSIPVNERNIPNYKDFKQVQKKKLICVVCT